MAFISRRKLLKIIEVEKIKEAIAEAEKRTSGEIRVSVARFFWGNIRRAAERAFIRLGMTRTQGRNGILFFVVPSRRRFVILGDTGIHAKVGQEFWDHLAEVMSEEFRKGEFGEGLIKGIQEAGEHLAIHFPYEPLSDKNELPDAIDFSGKAG
jgi:uncharacterized membrane protein